MKKFKFFLVIICGLFIFNVDVNAEEYTCSYNFTVDGLIFDRHNAFNYTVNTENKTIQFSSDMSYGYKIGAILDIAVDSQYEQYVNRSDLDVYSSTNDDEIRKILIDNVMRGNCARRVYVCTPLSDPETHYDFGILFNTQYVSEVNNFMIVNGLDDSGLSSYMNTNNPDDCFIVDIDLSSSTGNIVDTLVRECTFYNTAMENLRAEYNQCNGEAACLSAYNEDKEILRAFCSNDLKTGDYGLDPCIEKCLDFSSEIQEIEGFVIVGNECGVSDRIISFIANIVKWVKYIAPVLVIIFAIMDFIKAIASQSDDDMKKAQSRFIKRLIVAALVFIVPFLIEFVLNSFNIGSNNPYCNII